MSLKDQGQGLANAMETQKEVVEEPLLEDELLRDEIVEARSKDLVDGRMWKGGAEAMAKVQDTSDTYQRGLLDTCRMF